MAEPQQPPRSLRKDGNRRVYRDWSSADAVLQNSYTMDFHEEEAVHAPQEMHMLDEIAEDDAPGENQMGTPTEMVDTSTELPPLPVIVPAEPPPTQATQTETKPKIQITRVNKPTIQRARRYSQIKAEEEQQRQAAEEAAQHQAEIQHQASTNKTHVLAQNFAKTKELKQNIQEISHTIDETTETLKSTAQSLTENIRQIGDKLSASMTEGIKKLGHQLVGIISHWGKKSLTHQEAEDFEDEALPQAHSPSTQPLPAEPSPPPPQKAHLLAQVPPVPPVAITPLLKEGIQFLSFEKKLLPSESQLPELELQALFIKEALHDIQKCVKLVQKLPTPSEGPYQGIPLPYLFKNIREQDIYFFLHYVQTHPGAFKDKQFKFAEAFASWVLKRSHKTVITEPFPEVPPVSYYPLYKQNIRFLTFQKKALVLATGKSEQEINAMFMKHALADVKACVDFVAKFPAPEQGPYKGRPMRQIFLNISEKDIYFFLHYVKSQPDIFQNKNFKFSEAFASWVLKRSHETHLPV